MPELMKWAAQAVEMFPDSIFTRIDVAYYALADYFDTGDYAEAVRWGATYQEALSKYRAGEYDHSELLRGALEYTSPFWERKVFILMSHAYLELGEREKAFLMLQSIKGEEIEEVKQIGSVTNMMMRLHRTALLDTHVLVSAFWEQINRPTPSGNVAKQRRAAFLDAAAEAFPNAYRDEESAREETLRHGYTLFSALENQCTLGKAAVILDTDSKAELAAVVSQVENWDELPITALTHALNCGMPFPLPCQPLQVEEMDNLINRLTQQDKEGFVPLALKLLEGDFTQTLQDLCWARGLALAALRINDWAARKIPEGKVMTLSMDVPADPVADPEGQSLAVAQAFVRVENIYLQTCYTSALLDKDALFMLPPLHRFGWYCVRAFQALNRGDQVGYVRLLREGLISCERAKDVAEFLLEHIPPNVNPQEPSAEMATLAEQVRAMLGRFAPDDPAVAALKQSEAYQKVAYLIEGLEPPVAGGQTQ